MLRKSTDQLVIRPRLSGVLRTTLIALVILVVIGASFAGYWGGREAAYTRLDIRTRQVEALETELRKMRDLRRGLEAELAATRERLEEAKSSLTKVNRQLQIDKSAYQELRKEMENSKRKITELASELKFYRSIISPADGRSGVRIQDFEVRAADNDGEYRYRLVLIQALEHEDNVKGTVRFEIRGSGDDGATRTIHAPGNQRISADFKYFQNFAGTLRLPANFMPAEITVIFEAEGEAMVERMYPWPQGDGRRNA